MKVSSVTPTYNSDGKVCVYGKYFTNYSKVYVNGEKKETTFVDKNLFGGGITLLSNVLNVVNKLVSSLDY